VPGGGANIVAGFDLAGVNDGTKVTWVGEAQVLGRLTSIAGGLLEPLGKKNVQKLIDALQAALTAQAAAAAPAQAPPPDGDATKLAG
jgi:carbon monoxide dehydrogenase subunit G